LQRVARRYGTSYRFLCSWALAWRSHRLAGLALLLVLPAHVDAQTAITNANIGVAATAWLTNPTTATTTYGPIADWNTAAVRPRTTHAIRHAASGPRARDARPRPLRQAELAELLDGRSAQRLANGFVGTQQKASAQVDASVLERMTFGEGTWLPQQL
jgi:hypothetical protein